MDPLTVRMLERARARREKIDKSLNRGPSELRPALAENIVLPESSAEQLLKLNSAKTTNEYLKTSSGNTASPERKSLKSNSMNTASPKRKSSTGILKKSEPSPKSGSQSIKKTDSSPRVSLISPKTGRISTSSVKKSSSPATKNLCFSNVNNDNVALEINIVNNRDDIVIDVQVEEKEMKLSEYIRQKQFQNSATKMLPNSSVTVITSTKNKENEGEENKHSSKESGKADIRDGVKNRLQRLGVLYSDRDTLSSPIQRTEQTFNAESPKKSPLKSVKTSGQTENASTFAKSKKFGRLAALADQINNWEDDLTHHQFGVKQTRTNDTTQPQGKPDNKVQCLGAPVNISKPQTAHDKPPGLLDKKLVEALDAIVPKKCDETPACLQQLEGEDLQCFGDNRSLNAEPTAEQANENVKSVTESPVVPPIHDKIKQVSKDANLASRRNAVMSKAAMFEPNSAVSLSPRQRDPAEMSLRERKALFEKNNSVALLPKAPFGQALPAKHLNENANTIKGVSTCRSTATTAPSRSEPPPAPLQPGSGIRGKLAALFTTTTISGKEIQDRTRSERDREMSVLLNRFNQEKAAGASPHRNGEDDTSEKSPLIGDRVEDALQTHKKPEIVSNIPKSQDRNAGSAPNKTSASVKRSDSESSDSVIGQQPSKRRSSQDSVLVTTVLEDVKRIRVSGGLSTGGAAVDGRIYPHLSDIETATSSAPDESSECGGSSSLEISSEDCTASKQTKSSEWGETSFGRDLLAVVRNKRIDQIRPATTQQYSNSRDGDDSSSGDNTINSEIDNLLDEALEDDEDGGPTPPKINKNNMPIASDSFSYRRTGNKRVAEGDDSDFKSPLKENTNSPQKNKAEPLFHSVSFYRRKQNERESKPSTPVRVVKQNSINVTPNSKGEKPNREEMEALVRDKIIELSQEVNKQQIIISQASQAINLCAATVEFNQSTEQTEGEKLLLLATHRRHALLNEIQRLKVEGSPEGEEAMLSLTIKDISVPLRRDYVRKLNADGVVGHHVIGLIKCGARVVSTSMTTTAQTGYSVNFPDIIKLEDIPTSFKVTIEIYIMQASPEVLPHDVKYHIFKKTSKLLTPKSKASSSELRTPKIQSPCGPNAVRSTQFLLHGYCIFAMEQVKRNSFSLNKVPAGSPVEGAMGVSLSLIKPRPPPPPIHSDFLTIFCSVSGFGAWNRKWAKLQETQLSFWTYPEDEKSKIPSMTIDLSECISDQVIVAPRDVCARLHTILFDTKLPLGCPIDPNNLTIITDENGEPKMRYLLAADTKEERQEWLSVLNRALDYARSLDSE